jgi:hypothetical protein
MNMNSYLIIWEGRKCVEIRDCGQDSKACSKAFDEIMAPFDNGIIPVRTAQTYFASSYDALDIYVGYERDEKFRDEFDWSSDMADGDA